MKTTNHCSASQTAEAECWTPHGTSTRYFRLTGRTSEENEQSRALRWLPACKDHSYTNRRSARCFKQKDFHWRISSAWHWLRLSRLRSTRTSANGRFGEEANELKAARPSRIVSGISQGWRGTRFAVRIGVSRRTEFGQGGLATVKTRSLDILLFSYRRIACSSSFLRVGR